jgi:hypothetical protein
VNIFKNILKPYSHPNFVSNKRVIQINYTYFSRHIWSKHKTSLIFGAYLDHIVNLGGLLHENKKPQAPQLEPTEKLVAETQRRIESSMASKTIRRKES